MYNIVVLRRPNRLPFSACMARVLAERRLTRSELITRLRTVLDTALTHARWLGAIVSQKQAVFRAVRDWR